MIEQESCLVIHHICDFGEMREISLYVGILIMLFALGV